ncbi:MAG: AAA family ATPase [Hydrogenophaga sp.]|uniref:bifunctional aminoglycoside phosphotransferase/ATP-binding protein n=1 Tax=Hydrogenophaga sp. TaxID=1904254 RepID=UPI001D3F5AED|nr:AAA family ATPase [Hydrogenophaga sp.]MBX3610851.1 AAA family ATPase [Hydrogenophaga sp.]
MPAPTHADAALAASAALVARLAEREQAELIETHLSWVLLGASVAYKIKKPLRLPFVDYTSLAAREHFCQEEWRLNRRLAPSIYRDVVAITGSPDAPILGGSGPAIEVAVRMRRFEAHALLSERLRTGTLTPGTVDACADMLARFHATAPMASPDDGFATPERRSATAQAALAGAAPACRGDEAIRLGHWLHAQAATLAPLWSDRLAQGRLRECHGDLHLANLIDEDGVISAFDGIEFDPALRWIDVIDDIAFVVMDLHAGGRADLAFRLLNRWLDGSGDHAGLPTLRFAVVYRALVRTQVSLLQGQGDLARRYLDCALHWIEPGPTWLAIMNGLPGSGKSHVSQRLLEQHGAIRVRADVERKRLFGLAADANSRALGLNIYDRASGERTYAALLAAARAAIGSQLPVILDAAHLRKTECARAARLAKTLRVPFRIVPCEAPDEVLRQRIAQRHGDASEADVAVMEHLRTVAQALSPAEQAFIWRA